MYRAMRWNGLKIRVFRLLRETDRTSVGNHTRRRCSVSEDAFVKYRTDAARVRPANSFHGELITVVCMCPFRWRARLFAPRDTGASSKTKKVENNPCTDGGKRDHRVETNRPTVRQRKHGRLVTFWTKKINGAPPISLCRPKLINSRNRPFLRSTLYTYTRYITHAYIYIYI